MTEFLTPRPLMLPASPAFGGGGTRQSQRRSPQLATAPAKALMVIARNSSGAAVPKVGGGKPATVDGDKMPADYLSDPTSEKATAWLKRQMAKNK